MRAATAIASTALIFATPALSAGTAPSAASAPGAASAPASDTQERLSVEREFALAAPEIDRLNGFLQAELARVMSDSGAGPSPEVARLMSGAAAAKANLGDGSVPLHLRLIERKRLELAAAINWARSIAGHCGNAQFGPPQLVDAAFRQHMHEVLACRRSELERYQAGMAKLNKDREASVPALKLPRFAQESMLAQAREATRQQEAALEPIYKNRRITYAAIDDLFTFMDSHPAYLADNWIQFENDADRLAAQALIDRFTEAAKLPQ